MNLIPDSPYVSHTLVSCLSLDSGFDYCEGCFLPQRIWNKFTNFCENLLSCFSFFFVIYMYFVNYANLLENGTHLFRGNSTFNFDNFSSTLLKFL